MRFRDAASSSATLGFRVEGIRVGNATFADCKRLRTPQQLATALHWYLGGSEPRRKVLLAQLIALRHALEASEWVFRHELIGVSLLFVYDAQAHEPAGCEAARDSPSRSPQPSAPSSPAPPSSPQRPRDDWVAGMAASSGGKVVVRMIDFAKVVPLEPGERLTHRTTWEQGNREDGFLAGLDALIELWGEPLQALCDRKAMLAAARSPQQKTRMQIGE
eukprot:Transcript_3825.p4 GENE.Transcript_3825~~Transcript_3825.p4  ORF type:complete len:218 (+),score=87.05 Transcript_3825:1269-1922(+)